MVPDLAGRVDRRILVNYRVDPDVAAGLVPEPLRARLVDGAAMAGVCLIRLSALRPVGVPALLGIATDNAAHRIAVEWGEPDAPATGVYIRRRDTSSRLTALVGGRLFPGYHHHARVAAYEDHAGYHAVSIVADDGTADVAVRGREADRLAPGSAFTDLDEAVRFFCGAKTAYAATRRADRCDALELDGAQWDATALDVDDVRSAFYDRLAGTEFDSAVLMRCDRSRWRPLPALAVRPRPGSAPVSPPFPGGTASSTRR